MVIHWHHTVLQLQTGVFTLTCFSTCALSYLERSFITSSGPNNASLRPLNEPHLSHFWWQTTKIPSWRWSQYVSRKVGVCLKVNAISSSRTPTSSALRYPGTTDTTVLPVDVFMK
jgi:hypothetical protein